jgi:glycosyltransferase involved in cell wall biosynthesis
VAVNAVFLRAGLGGIVTYVRELLPHLVSSRPDVRFTLLLNPQAHREAEGEDWTAGARLVSHPLVGRRYTSAVSELTALAGLVEARGVDLVHSVAMLGPLGGSAARVVTVHDLTWRHDRESPDRVTTTLWRAFVPAVVRRADRVLTCSAATRRDVLDQLGVPEGLVDVVPNGPGTSPINLPTPERELRERLGLGRGPVVLSVSAKKTHKNLGRLLDAMADVVAGHPTATLVLPGSPTPHEEELRDRAERLGIAERVRFLAWVDDRDLEGLYAASACFVFPSLLEGFGLPILEAMRRGLPVACSRASSLPEVAGDAAEYFDPLEAGSIAAAVLRLIGDRAHAEALVAAGRRRERSFSWEATARGTLTTYDRAWTERRRVPVRV